MPLTKIMIFPDSSQIFSGLLPVVLYRDRREMKRVQSNIGFSEMPVSKLGEYFMEVEQPYLVKALSTFGLCANTISGSDINQMKEDPFSKTSLNLANLIQN